MPLQIVRNDITKMNVDAIVNATDPLLTGGGGVDGSIHRAAGPEMQAECQRLQGCPVGEARITGGYRLPCKYVIHTVGPRWFTGRLREREQLAACYRSALCLAAEHGLHSVAFPLIASGTLGCPKDQALRIAVDTIGSFLFDHDMLVYLVIFDKSAYQIGSRLFSEIAAYIDDRYVDEQERGFPRRNPMEEYPEGAPICARMPRRGGFLGDDDGYSVDQEDRAAWSLEDALKQLDESFSEMLLRKIDESGMTDAACYKKANIDRKLFSKIKNDRQYKPSKTTALAFCLALELPMDEIREMLGKAGYALTHASRFDIIVEYFVAQGNYNVFEINEALFAFDQSLIGV